MNEPILEALTFALDTDLQVDSVRASVSGDRDLGAGAGSSHSHSQRARQHQQQQPRNSQCILPSHAVLWEGYNTPCLAPNCQFISEPFAKKENKDAFLAHLLGEHNIVIDDVDKIANLHKYVIHWKERFLTAPIEEFCVGFVMDEIPEPPAPALQSQTSRKRPGQENQDQGQDQETETSQTQTEKDKPKPMYYMLTHALEEDKLLRNAIWNSRLETVLEVNRQEREQTDFSRQCFFCREVFKGNRSSLFSHLEEAHSFRIGKSDNIVFVEEFLELIAGKLKELICLNCEKVFKDKTILRDHMRKKGHKRLNSNNPEYNRYYIINYLEPGKDWKILEEEEPIDERVEEDWCETNEEITNIVCLLCSEQSTSFDEVLAHMKSKHGFDFEKIASGCDFYEKVKIVNFIRRAVFLNTCLYCEKKFLERTTLVSHLSAQHTSIQNSTDFPTAKVWNQPVYFFPTFENDQFLVLLDKDNQQDDDIDSLTSSEDEPGRLVIPEDPPKFLFSTAQDIEKMDLN